MERWARVEQLVEIARRHDALDDLRDRLALRFRPLALQ